MNKGSLFFHLHHHTLPRQRAGAERGGGESNNPNDVQEGGCRPSVRPLVEAMLAGRGLFFSFHRGRKRENNRRSRRPPAGSGGGGGERGDPFRKQAASPPPPPFPPQPANGAGADGPSDEEDSARPQGGRGGKELRCGERRARDSKVARAHEGRSGGELPSSALLLVERSRYHRGGCSTHFSLRRRRGGKGYRERGSGLRSPFLALHCHGSALSLSLSGLAGGEATRGCRAFACDSDPFSFGRERMQGYGQTAEKRRRGAIGGIYQTARHSTRRAVFIAFFYVGDW